MNEYAHLAFKLTADFPKSEIYGVTSQLRRSSLSIILNYVEGYARKRPLVRFNFLETSYGSLQESKYLLEFSYAEKYLTSTDYDNSLRLAEEIGAMLWKEIEHLEKSLK